MIDLFEHNRIAYESAVAMLVETGKAAVIHPTGTGKSFIGFKLYAMANGNLTVPLKYTTPDGFKLGKWLSIQRRENNAGKLSAERKRLLDAIHMVWSFAGGWERGCRYAKAYYEEHGYLDVSAAYGFKLGDWLHAQRRVYEREITAKTAKRNSIS